ncbi:MAG: 1-acyl-sn-glycerol-3-phosphate acyltransferase [Acidobacteria bacterium]|nr:1-acyl-sn-glycerol-3-phosphate acyltransferase [Acidobacteriota bacterium]
MSAVIRIYFRMEIRGLENVPEEGAMIVAPNHVSYMDPIWVSSPLKRPLRYMTWDRMTGLPLLGALMRAYGAFPVNIESASGDRSALRHSLEQLRAGGGLMIFPEGSRSRDGRLMSFKPGVIRLALAADVPIIPVSIVGGFDAYPPHFIFPRPYKVKVIYHEPIKLSPPSNNSQLKDYMREETERLRLLIASKLPPESLPLEEERTQISQFGG